MIKMKSITACAIVGLLLLAAPAADAQKSQVQSIDQLSKAIEHMTVKVCPAVVHITATSYGPAAGLSPTAESLIAKRRSGGSGVILHPDGYIITNAHVKWRTALLLLRLVHTACVRLASHLSTRLRNWLRAITAQCISTLPNRKPR